MAKKDRKNAKDGADYGCTFMEAHNELRVDNKYILFEAPDGTVSGHPGAVYSSPNFDMSSSKIKGCKQYHDTGGRCKQL